VYIEKENSWQMESLYHILLIMRDKYFVTNRFTSVKKKQRFGFSPQIENHIIKMSDRNADLLNKKNSE